MKYIGIVEVDIADEFLHESCEAHEGSGDCAEYRLEGLYEAGQSVESALRKECGSTRFIEWHQADEYEDLIHNGHSMAA